MTGIALVSGLGSALAAAPDAVIAIAVVFDTSGSMRKNLAADRTPAGRKSEVARRVFGNAIERLERFARTQPEKPLAVGIYAFKGREAFAAHALAPFDPAALRRWLQAAAFESATPLGEAFFLAGRDLLAAPAASRHLLVLTDGENTAGRTPEAALAQVNEAAGRKGVPVFAHVIAFDIKPGVFAALQKQGATLIGAADEAQLQAQFDFILEEKILVEAER